MEKDLLLLVAALSADSIILSRDEKVRRLFARAARRVQPIANILWVDPVRDVEISEWLAGTAPPRESWRLGAYSPKSN